MALTEIYAPKPQVRLVRSNLCFDEGLAEVMAAGATGLASLSEVTLERPNMANGNQLVGRIREGVLASSFMGAPPHYALVRNGFPGLSLEDAKEARRQNTINRWFLVGDSCYELARNRATVSGEYLIIDNSDLHAQTLVVPFDEGNQYARFMLGGKGTEDEVTARTKACIDYFKGQNAKLESIELFVPKAEEVIDSKGIIATQFWAGAIIDSFSLIGSDRSLFNKDGVFGCRYL